MQNVSRSINHNKSGILLTRSLWLFLPFSDSKLLRMNETVIKRCNDKQILLLMFYNMLEIKDVGEILSKNFPLFFFPSQSVLNTPSLFIAQVQMTKNIKQNVSTFYDSFSISPTCFWYGSVLDIFTTTKTKKSKKEREREGVF